MLKEGPTRTRRSQFELRGETFPFNRVRDGASLARLDPDAAETQTWKLAAGAEVEIRPGDVREVSRQVFDMELPPQRHGKDREDPRLMKALDDIKAGEAERAAMREEMAKMRADFRADVEAARKSLQIRTYQVKTLAGEDLAISDLDGVQIFCALAVALNFGDHTVLRLASGQTHRVLVKDLEYIASQIRGDADGQRGG